MTKLPGKPYAILTNGAQLFTNEMTESVDRYAAAKKLPNIRCFLADNKGDKTYLLADGRVAIYENTSAEAIGAHIDMLAVAKQFDVSDVGKE